jgi:hypothetical protein
LALEAMKMENELRATAAGVVQAIAVVPGQAVERGRFWWNLPPGRTDPNPYGWLSFKSVWFFAIPRASRIDEHLFR